MMRPLYFDYNATTPILPVVFEAMRPFLTEHFGNPGSGHAWGMRARRAVDQARAQVAGLINCRPEEVYFTSCATESNNLVLRGLLEGVAGAHLVTTAMEHPAILEPARALAYLGLDLTLAGVDGQGLVDPGEVERACRPRTSLVSVMLANNETGAIQPLAEIASAARERGIPVHSDASQAVGKIAVDVAALGLDLMTIAGHKLYAPKGVGALYVREGLKLAPQMRGGGQERGLRSGTENVAFLVGLGAACELASQDLAQEEARQRGLGRLFLEGLAGLGADHMLFAEASPRLPGTMFVGFGCRRAADIISGLAGLDVAVSAGAACHGDATSLSHVLAAMAAPPEYAPGTIRFSWGRPTTPGDVAELLERLGQVLAQLG